MSLKEQMLKAGLITEQQARQATHKERVTDKKTAGKDRAARAEAARKEAREQAEKQKALDRERARAEQGAREAKGRDAGELHQRREVAKKAVREGELTRWGGTRTYYFEDGKRVEYLKVSDEAARKLEAGQAAIVLRNPGGKTYTVIEGASARQLQEAAPDRVIVFHR